MELKQLIEDYLHEARMMQVATAQDNQPWACTVYFAYDEKWNLYWVSFPTRRHSQEIRNNEKVAGVIVLPHTPGDKVRGLQFQGTAKELTDSEEIKQGMEFYSKRYNLSEEKAKRFIDRKSDHLCYRITPSLFVLFDDLNFPKDPRKEYYL